MTVLDRHRFSIVGVLIAFFLIALVVLVVTFARDRGPTLSSDVLADCAWQTNCWHKDYYEAFVHDGLVKGRTNEGSLFGWIAYRIEAISTQELFTFFSILFSVLVFLAGLQYGRCQDRRAHTLEVIMGIFNSDALAAANVRLSAINLEVTSGERTLDGSISGDDDAAIITMLDYYEFICQGVFEGALSAHTVREVRGGAMRSTYETCRIYINDRRASLKRDRLYWAIEQFVKREIGNKPY